MVEEDDLYGDGVNVAARLEQLAEPGGIAISGTVREHVEGKLDARFADAGEQRVKNLARPVHVFRWSPVAEAAAALAAVSGPEPTVQNRPSIAVLPFDNLSGDPGQAHLADGIAEDVISLLSRVRWLLVIARNSTFTYKGRAVDVQEVAEELGVRYVLEGSVRSAGKRIRVSAQLIDAPSRSHLWAQRYDRELEDLFALQDEITEAIVGALEPELGAAERERARHKPPHNLDAWSCYQRGLWQVYRYQRADVSEALPSVRTGDRPRSRLWQVPMPASRSAISSTSFSTTPPIGSWSSTGLIEQPCEASRSTKGTRSPVGRWGARCF